MIVELRAWEPESKEENQVARLRKASDMVTGRDIHISQSIVNLSKI